jgi:hypothetical protein
MTKRSGLIPAPGGAHSTRPVVVSQFEISAVEAVMGFLDLFEKDQSIAARPQPNEGTQLPGFYELHREEILIGGAILIAAVLLIAAFHYRTYLRNGLIIVLAGILRMLRQAATVVRLFWREVADRAN